MLCTFFKAGSCSKGSKCKFSHDLNVGRKVEKVNVYEDTRKDDKKTGAVMEVGLADFRYNGHLGRRKVAGCCQPKCEKADKRD